MIGASTIFEQALYSVCDLICSKQNETEMCAVIKKCVVESLRRNDKINRGFYLLE